MNRLKLFLCALLIAPAVSFAGSSGGTSGGLPGADEVTESMLKVVDAAGDEECLTYESTVGDFEWQSCGGGEASALAPAVVIEGATADAFEGNFTFADPTADWTLAFDADGDATFPRTVLSLVLVEANTAGSGSPNILAATESGAVLTNEGATAENYHTLPSAAAGLKFCFANQDSDDIRITANTGDTIKLGSATVSASAGFVRSIVQGSVLCLLAINDAEWFSLELSGEWTIDE